MDFTLKDVVVPRQEEDAPFIGDAMDIDNMDYFEVASKKVQVTSISFNKQKFLAEVALTADFGEVPRGHDFIIVGVRLMIVKEAGGEDETTALWQVAGTSLGLREVNIDIELTPGPIILKSFWVMSINDFSSVQSIIPSALRIRYQDSHRISVICEKSELVEKDYLNILVQEDKDKFFRLKHFFWNLNNFVTQNISKCMTKLSSENWVFATFYSAKQFMWAQESIQLGDNFLDSIVSKYAKKRDVINVLSERDLMYLSNYKDFEKLRYSSKELYVLSINTDEWESNQHIFSKFLRLREHANGDFAILDLDLVNQLGLRPFVIKSFKNGVTESEDILKDIKNATKNIVKYDGKWQNIAPKSRALLEIPCPGYQWGDCPNVKVQWVCSSCHSNLYYGFDKYFYCYCGGGDITKFKFRCGRNSHQDDFFPLKGNKLLEHLQPIKPLNIIILGQSGVGKSTWINAFVNYVTFKSLDEARNSDFPVPIPVKFSVADENYKNREIVCGNYDASENLKLGESATQQCKEYNIIFEDKVINLIDTPGLGDSRGIDEDKKNVKKILDFLSHVDVIHGICLVLKPNEARITVLLKYCLKEILSNLHKSSKDNLMFCFTHARQTFYRGGETLPTLKELLSEIGIDETCLDRSFHMDNEAFRFLCCQSANIKFPREEEESFSESWEHSAKATKRLLDTVSSMDPHLTSETLSLNRSRKIILTLIPFMVEITENIERNLRQLDDHKKLIQTHQGSLDELKNQRFSTQIDIQREALNHPRTVCANEGCVRYEFLAQSGERQAIYKTHCHSHCYLSGETPDVYPNPELRGCAAMGGHLNCQMCKCGWNVHMHIWYEQKLTEKAVKDDDVERRINEYKDKNTLKEDLIAADEKRIDALESEKKTVISTCVKFACFLSANAIVPYNDSFLDYLEVTLRAIKNIKNKTNLDEDRIEKMAKMKELYLEERNIFTKVKKDSATVTLEEIATSENDLYMLPIHGKQLQEIMKKAIANQSSAPRDASSTKSILATGKKSSIDKLVGVMDESSPSGSNNVKPQKKEKSKKGFNHKDNYNSSSWPGFWK